MARERTNNRKNKPYLDPSMPGHGFRLKLIQLLDERGLSPERAAAAHGWEDGILSKDAIQRFIAGESVPRLDAMMRIAEAFGVSANYLADDEVPVDGPRTDAEASGLTDMERYIIKKSRIIGIDDAARIVGIVEGIGKVKALSRLLAVGPAEGGQVGVGQGGEVLLGNNHSGHPAGGDDPAAKRNPRKRGQ